ncbi:hypothetical protein ABLE68_04910 [Nocardioides sp. CN2-186]|uniref:hypothetical protein n=1 Tax=Nocardioides tweenelious TaxID=3156607 RepID=UPI0032B3F3E5
MSELHGSSETGPEWLTPTGAAIAGFTLAVLSLITNGAWLLAVQAFMQRNGSASYGDVVIATGVAQGVFAIAALVMAKRGLDSTETTARNLGSAGTILALLGMVVAVLTVVAGLIAAN